MGLGGCGEPCDPVSWMPWKEPDFHLTSPGSGSSKQKVDQNQGKIVNAEHQGDY